MHSDPATHFYLFLSPVSSVPSLPVTPTVKQYSVSLPSLANECRRVGERQPTCLRHWPTPHTAADLHFKTQVSPPLTTTTFQVRTADFRTFLVARCRCQTDALMMVDGPQSRCKSSFPDTFYFTVWNIPEALKVFYLADPQGR